MGEAEKAPKPRLRWYQYRLGSGLDAPLYVTAFFVVLLILAVLLGGHARSLFTTFIAYLVGLSAACLFAAKLILKRIRGDTRLFRDRPLQYHLWHLFVLITVVAIACSWFTCKMRRAARQREAVAVVEQFSGYVRYDYYRYETLPGEYHRTMVGKPPGPSWLRDLVGLDFLSDVTSASLRGPQVTDAVLQDIEGLTHLEELRLNDTNVTDEGIKRLQKALPDCKIHY